MKKCVNCGKDLSYKEIETSDSIFITCKDCDFSKLNLFNSKPFHYIYS